MSLRTMIRRSGQTCDILALTTAQGAGGQLTKTYTIRHEAVPCANNVLGSRKEMLYFGQHEVFAESLFYIEFREGIEHTDRVRFRGRTFSIKKVDNYDEIDLYLRIAVEEV